MENTLIFGEAITELSKLDDRSIDFIFADPPYQKTKFSWDFLLPLEEMWFEIKRILKPNKVCAIFGNEPFSSKLRVSNLNQYKYDWVWNKKIPSGIGNAKIMPMRQTENISIFIDGKNWYYPQMIERDKPIVSGGMIESLSAGSSGMKRIKKKTYTEKFPTTLLEYDKVRRGNVHPTQKPIDLLEYIIKTYTSEGDTVLDFTCGSGSTLIAARNLNRRFIGIDNGYCEKDKTINEIQIKGKSWIEIAQLRLSGELP